MKSAKTFISLAIGAVAWLVCAYAVGAAVIYTPEPYFQGVVLDGATFTAPATLAGKAILIDSQYYCPTPAELHRMLLELGKDKTKYRADVYDCDDFAFTFRAKIATWWNKQGHTKPLAVAVIGAVVRFEDGKVGGHAFNGIFLANGRLVLIEPQAGRAVSGWRILNAYFFIV